MANYRYTGLLTFPSCCYEEDLLEKKGGDVRKL
jgi:hypothetical protein